MIPLILQTAPHLGATHSARPPDDAAADFAALLDMTPDDGAAATPPPEVLLTDQLAIAVLSGPGQPAPLVLAPGTPTSTLTGADGAGAAAPPTRPAPTDITDAALANGGRATAPADPSEPDRQRAEPHPPGLAPRALQPPAALAAPDAAPDPASDTPNDPAARPLAPPADVAPPADPQPIVRRAEPVSHARPDPAPDATFAEEADTPPPAAPPRAAGARSAESAVLMRAGPDAAIQAPPQGAAPSPDAAPSPAGQLLPDLTLQSAFSDAARSTAAPAAPPSPAPPLPTPTIPALVQAVRQTDSDTVELVLAPEDLGKLRFEVTQTGDQMRIHLTVERPETLDLLRRHADHLLTEFRQAGFAGATLSFGQSGQGGQHGNPRPQARHPALHDPLPSAPPPPHQTGAGLDLRL